MGFRDSFEKHVNENMSGTPSSSKPSLRIDTEGSPKTLKKRLSIPTPALEADVVDDEIKYDRPPRFSTIFGPSTLPPRPNERSPALPPRRSGGVFVPTSVFVLLISLIVFEGLAIFAYTVIGLYNNLPMRLMNQQADRICPSNDRMAVNISPNFMMGGNAAPSNLLPAADLAVAASTTSVASSSTTVSSTSTSFSDWAASSSTAAAAVASDMVKMFAGMNSQASGSVHTVRSTAFVTVDPSGSQLPPQSTVTAIQVVQASPVVITSTAERKRSVEWVEAVFDPTATSAPAK